MVDVDGAHLDVDGARLQRGEGAPLAADHLLDGVTVGQDRQQHVGPLGDLGGRGGDDAAGLGQLG